MPDVLADGGVALRPFLPEHVSDDYLAWLNDPEVMRFTEARFTGHTRDSARAYVERSNSGADARLWRIVAGGRHVGNIRLSGIDHRHRRASVALIIGARDAWGQGIGTGAIRLASRYGFDALSLHKLCAGMYVDNAASIRAFEKAGFRREAVLAGHYLYQGRFIDGVLVARFAGDPDR